MEKPKKICYTVDNREFSATFYACKFPFILSSNPIQKINTKRKVRFMNFKNIPKEYRPIPFWSWNEKLDAEETREQVRKMNEAGIGGFFMHARGGLQTEYMGKDWY